jgi:DNA-binding NtrC family response regulator
VGDFGRVGCRARVVNVRIVSATNSNLAEEVSSGRFRRDLLFRLNTIEISRRRWGAVAHPGARVALPPARAAA